MRKRHLTLLSALLCLALLAGCTSNPVADLPAPGSVSAVPNEDGEIGSAISNGGDTGGGIPFLDAFCSSSASSIDAAPMEKWGVAEAPSAAMAGAVEGERYLYGEGQLPTPAAGLLTAGAWDDNRDWGKFRDNAGQSWKDIMDVWSLYPTHRVEVRLTDGDAPVKGVPVRLLAGEELLWQGVTDYEGRAFLFWGLTGKGSAPDRVEVLSDGQTGENWPLEPDQELLEAHLSAPDAGEKQVDVLFLVDTTGSMGDELEYLKRELADVMERAGQALPGTALRLSVNFYRDEGDEYVVRYFRFHEDIALAVEDLMAQSANGGGDYPEAVDQALDNAVSGHAWEEGAEKLLFLVLDAPPHADRQGVPESLYATITKAAAMGIRIIPVASSGVDEETEFLTRSAAVLTGGTYTFLTNDSGIGYDHKEPTNLDYDVEPLNELLLRLIVQYAGA